MVTNRFEYVVIRAFHTYWHTRVATLGFYFFKKLKHTYVVIILLYAIMDTFGKHFSKYEHGSDAKTPIPLDGDSATIRKFGQSDTNRSRNGKSAVESQ